MPDMKKPTLGPTYFTKIEVMAGAGAYGSGDTPEKALTQCVKALKADFGRLFDLKKARPTVKIYRIGEGRYAFWDERGVFEIDRETDQIACYAEVVRVMGDVNLYDLTDYTPREVEDAYIDGAKGLEKLRALNTDRAAPIGESVPA